MCKWIKLCKLLQINSIPYVGTYNSNFLEGDNMFNINFNKYNDIKELLIKNKVSTCIFCIVQRRNEL